MISAFFEKSMGEYDNAHKIHRAGVEFLQSRLQLKSGNLEHALRAAQSAATRLDGVDAGTENDAYRQLVTDLAKQEIKIKHAVQQVATVRN